MIRTAVVVPIRDEQERVGATGKAERVAALMENQYKTTFKGLGEFEARPFVVVDADQSRSLFGFSYARHRDVIGDWPTHYVGLGGWKAGINGEAIVGSNRAWIYGSGNDRTVIHEFGHCLGRGHANRPGQEYGDLTCMMGKGSRGWNVLALRTFGLIRPDHVKEIDQGSVYLVPVECSPACVWPGEHQMAVVYRDSGPLVISTRKHNGQHFDGIGSPNLLYVHTPDPPNLNGYRSSLIATLRRGETYHGIRHGGSREGVVRAVVGHDDSSPWPEMIVRQGIESGKFVNRIWHNPNHYGQGLDLYLTGQVGQEIVGWWYSHSVKGYTPRGPASPEDNGQRWYFMQCRIDDGIVRAKIMRRTDDGMVTAGNGVIRFDAEDRAVFRYYTDDYGRDQLELQALSAVREGDLSGAYATGFHEGLTWGAYRQPDGRVSATGYLFDADGWRMMDGQPDDFSVIEVRSRYKSVLPDSLVNVSRGSFDGRTLRYGDTSLSAEKFI